MEFVKILRLRLRRFSIALALMLAGLVTFAIPAQPQNARAKITRDPEVSADRSDVALFAKKVDAILQSENTSKAYWGVFIEDQDTGEVLYDLNSDHFFTPASNAKVVTTALALSELGETYHFRTTLESNGALGTDGRLAGDLLLVGRGDPDLSNRKFPYVNKAEREGAVDKVLAELADAAVVKGLRTIDGDIIGDDSYFPYDPYPASWTVGDIFFTFGAPVSAIDFNDNSFGIIVQPGARVGDPALLKTEPAASYTSFTSEITTVSSSFQPDFSVLRQPSPNFILVRGSMPLGHAPIRLDFAMTDPAQQAAATLKQLLEARGVTVTGSVRVQHAPPPQRSANGAPPMPTTPNAPAVSLSVQSTLLLAEHMSPPLLESVRLTNKISQNLHAELFLRTVAKEKSGVGSIDAGLQLEKDFLRAAGVPEGEIQLSDGSGLARDDLVTPRAMAQLLRYAARQSWGADFMSTMPIAGVDGTIEDRMKQTKALGVLEAKTGSLEHVHALSGYATSAAGEHLVFAIFANNDTLRGREATAPVDAIGDAMIQILGTHRAPKP
jgi:D-alanyl-D-alanine carboxypeptidase/D-alanyl-D-alanine-endopeptidase (penicillin-binding protein 4)